MAGQDLLVAILALVLVELDGLGAVAAVVTSTAAHALIRDPVFGLLTVATETADEDLDLYADLLEFHLLLEDQAPVIHDEDFSHFLMPGLDTSEVASCEGTPHVAHAQKLGPVA